LWRQPRSCGKTSKIAVKAAKEAEMKQVFEKQRALTVEKGNILSGRKEWFYGI
jgi:hypothetical protein